MKKIILLLVPFLFWNATSTPFIKKKTAVVASYNVQAVRNQILEKGEFAYNFGNGLEGELKNLKETKDVTFENAPIMESFSFKGEEFVMVDDNQSVIYISDIDYSTQTQSEVFIINDTRAYNHYVRTLLDERQAEYAAEGTVTSRNQNSFIIRKSLSSKRVPKQFGPDQNGSANCGVKDSMTVLLAPQPSFTTMSATTSSSSTAAVRDHWRVIIFVAAYNEYTNDSFVDYWPSVRRTMQSWRSLTPDSPNTPNSMLSWPNGSYYGVRSPLPLRFSLASMYYNYNTSHLENQLDNFKNFVMDNQAQFGPYPFKRTLYEFIRPSGWPQGNDGGARGIAQIFELNANGEPAGSLRIGANSTSSDQCLAHEIGHGLGMAHDMTLYNWNNIYDYIPNFVGSSFIDVMYTPLGPLSFHKYSWIPPFSFHHVIPQSYTFNGANNRIVASSTIHFY